MKADKEVSLIEGQLSTVTPPRQVNQSQIGGFLLSLPLILFAVLIIVGIIIAFLQSCLCICKPNEVVVLSGRKRRNKSGQELGYRVITGGRGIRSRARASAAGGVALRRRRRALESVVLPGRFGAAREALSGGCRASCARACAFSVAFGGTTFSRSCVRGCAECRGRSIGLQGRHRERASRFGPSHGSRRAARSARRVRHPRAASRLWRLPVLDCPITIRAARAATVSSVR